MNEHTVIKVKKERIGWGKWGIIITRLCPATGKELRIRKNWHGPKPNGGIVCPHCSTVISL